MSGPRLIRPTEPPGVFRDERGTFVESWSGGFTAVAGLTSVSRRGALRGLHFQRERPRGLLVRCVRGRIWDVCVDLRAGHVCRWYAHNLSAYEHTTLHVPPGFAHGFCALAEDSVVVYEADAPFDAATESTLLWCDPLIKPAWYGIPPNMPLIISEKDQAGLPLERTGTL